MCRLYGFHATEPTKVECTLVHAQNALMAQSRSDLESVSHSHGWGVATYPESDGAPRLERQAWAAHHGEHFQRAAARAYAETVIAHVRRATVGVAALENTHPFVHERWVFAHNGTVPRFDQVRERLLGEIAPAHRALIKGQTDSEHLFRYALTLLEAGQVAGPRDAVARVVKDVVAMTREVAPDDPIGLNLMLTDGDSLAGTRLGRTLVYVARDGVYDCEICGFPHIHHDPRTEYRAVVVASEPITSEQWNEAPEGSLWRVNLDLPGLEITELPL